MPNSESTIQNPTLSNQPISSKREGLNCKWNRLNIIQCIYIPTEQDAEL